MYAGYLALILHAHLPFVRHPEHAHFLEEDWLFEAVAETYLPLLRMLRRMVVEHVPVKLTLTLTPTLCAMLRDSLLKERTARYMNRGAELAAAEIERTAGNALLQELARFYHKRFQEALDFYERELQRDIVGGFAQLQADGVVEIITCAATHGFLPLMEHLPEALRAQILIGRDYYRDCFGEDPKGIWLPECAYVPGVASVLQEANLRWFIVDAHGLMYGNPRPRFAIYAPCYLPQGPAVFARDRDSSRQVWSAEEGYPGDPAYRDFYRDIGHEQPEEYLRRFGFVDGQRHYTGIKYHRITTRNGEKEIYRRDWAMGAVEAHATDFMESRKRQIAHLRELMGVPAVVVSPFDAELFGHWWFEGPEFLDLFLRKAAYDQDVFRFITPTDFLRLHPTAQICFPSASSWGHKGYWEVWLDESNAWIYPHLHAAARGMIETAKKFSVRECTPFQERMLRQMARELLLAQASDWAFLMKTGTAREYATRRTKDHLLRFNRLKEELTGGVTASEVLEACEERDNLFPDVNWRYYAEEKK